VLHRLAPDVLRRLAAVVDAPGHGAALAPRPDRADDRGPRRGRRNRRRRARDRIDPQLYKAQAPLIRNKIEARSFERLHFRVIDSIDRIQGQETISW
jgi:hypothetical protein